MSTIKNIDTIGIAGIATAGLAKIVKEHNASKLANDYRISLGFDYSFL